MWQTTQDQIHAFFQARGFVYVDTPLIVQTPGMEPNLDPIEVQVNKQQKGLITSPEYAMKKLLGAGMEKIYTITKVFRNFEGGRHNRPEFTMLEWYAPGNYEDLMNETEDLLQEVLGDPSPWQRLTFKEASVDEHGDPHTDKKRFFITKYPSDQAALAKLSADNTYAERFEAFADGLELCNGFCELTDSDEQRRRFKQEQEERKAQNKTIFPIDEELLEAIGKIKGSIYGNALGVDRLVMLKYACSDINDIHVFDF